MSSRCVNCLLPAEVPGSDLDSQGTCLFCREYADADPGIDEQRRSRQKEDLEKTLKDIRGRGLYDCLVCLSGGKDSVYLMSKLVHDYHLKVLAYTDNFDLPQVAQENIARTVTHLDVDHVVFTPPKEFYRKLIRFLLKNQDRRGAVYSVCYVWAPIREGNALRLAIEKGIPLVLAGYAPGQPEPERMLYEMSPRLISQVDWTPDIVRESGLFDERDLERFWNPTGLPPGTVFPRFLAPFHAWDYDQSFLIDQVIRQGLIRNRQYASPVHSNFTINWLLMYSDLINLGYNPYAPEFCKLIREGKANRAYWKLMAPIVDWMILNKVFLGHHVQKAMDWLELTEEELSRKDSVVIKTRFT